MNNLIKQLVSFIGYSGIGWILDFSTYTILALLSVNLFLCNALGAVAGVTFVFIFSTRYIFQNNSKIPLFTKYIIYILYQVVLIYFVSKLLVMVNSLLLSNLNFSFVKEFCAILSKIIITPITMLLNFIVLKNVIEKI